MLAYYLLPFILSGANSLEPCTDYCPPQPIITEKSIMENDDSSSDFLDRDDVTGCYCRLYTDKMGCFGRNVCRRIPQKMHSPKPILSILTTRISEIKLGELDIYYNITSLYIEQNLHLSVIDEGVFGKMINLTTLSISYNPSLKSLRLDTFKGLSNLTQLFLISDGFVNILDATLPIGNGYLPKLLRLSLKENNFAVIKEDAFATMNRTSLEELNLVLCRIEYIHPNALLPLKNLKALRIGLNSFNESILTDLLNATIEENIPLHNLNLYSLGFLRRPPKGLLNVIANSGITHLNLSKNRFEVLTKDSFPWMPNLKLLDLADVVAFNITKDAFVNLPNLKTLILSGNKLTDLPQGVLQENITYLDLQQNTGSLFFNSYFRTTRSKFINMKNLQYLNLGYNKLDALYHDTFEGLENLRILGLKNATIRFVTNNTFHKLQKLEFLNLENNYFVKNNPVGLEDMLFYGLENLRVLQLGGNYISFLSECSDPFRHLKHLEYLDLSRNLITNLSPNDFMHLLNIKRIDLSYNSIISWQQRVFANNTNLGNVNLSNNKLTYFSETVLEDLSNITEVDLSSNSFSCDCSVYLVFKQWLNNNNQHFLNVIHNHKVFCNFPTRYENVTVDEFIRTDVDDLMNCDMDDIASNLFIILPLFILILLLVSFLFFLYYYRYHVRYWMFLTRLYLSRKGKIKSKGTKQTSVNYKYDAFVSYSNEDRNFVLRLVTMLEDYDPFLKLCVYERDFQIGTFISENVLENVASSRRTILIISDNYAKSQWCRWESHIAHHHKLFLQNDQGEYVDDTLILIKIGPVSGYHLTPTLKYLLKTRIYLQWDSEEKRQKEFWEKLRKTLKPLKNEIEENTHM